MKKNANIRDIAEKAGVSVASVSRALQSPPSNKVSPKLRAKIVAICDEMRYSPNMHTLRMFSKRSNTIALFVPPECMHFFNPLGGMDFNLATTIAGVEYELEKESIYLTIASVTEKFLEQKEYLKFSRGQMVDGIIIWGWSESDTYLFELAEEDIPIVMIQSSTPELPLIQINPQDYEGMGQIVEYIAKLGHKNIAYIPPPKISRAGKTRKAGFVDAANSLNLNYSITDIGGFDFEHGVLAATEIIKNQPNVTCIVAANDMVALGVIETLQDMGLKIPYDISVTGADGIMLPRSKQLTTYISPSFDIARESARRILKLINKEEDNKDEKEFQAVTLVKGMTVLDINKQGERI